MNLQNYQQNIFTKIYGNKDFVKKMMKLFIPAILQSLLTTIVLYVDNFSLAILIDDDVAANAAKNALGLANPILNFLGIVVICGVGIGGIMMAQYFGNQQQDMTRKTTAFRTWFGMCLIIPLVILTCCIPGILVQITTNVNQGLEFEFAKTYLWITSLTMIPQTIATALSFSLQETKKAGISLLAAGGGFGTNIIFDPIVIIIAKTPEEAVMLVGVTTGIARIVQTAIIIAYIIIKKDRNIWFFNEWKMKWNEMKKIFTNGASTFINDMFFGVTSTILSVCLLRFNTEIHNATTNVVMLIGLVSIVWPGMATATAVLVGSNLGAGNVEQAKNNANKMLRWGLTFSLSLSFVLFVLGFFINPILSPAATKKTNQLATYMLWALLPVITCQGVFSATYYSIKTGGSKITLIIDALVMLIWTTMISAITFTNTAANWDPIGYIVLINSYQVAKMIIALLVYKNYDWARVLTDVKIKNIQDVVEINVKEINNESVIWK